MPFKFTFVLLLLIPSPSFADDDWPVRPPPTELDQPTMARLRKGDVLVENTNLDGSGGSARVLALFSGSAHQVWEHLGDCESNLLFVDGLRDCELMQVEESRAVTRQSVKKYFLLPRLDYTFETARQPYDWVAIRLLSGDLKAMHGSWRFDPLAGEDAVLVTHRIHVQPKMPAPGWLVRRTLRKDVGDMVACLRAIAGASLNKWILETDRQRCP